METPQVAILCGGLGTRLRASVANRPKALAEVAGRPFLAWVLDILYLHGFKRVVLCTGHLGEQVEAVLGATKGGLNLRYSHEQALLGTGGALRQALPLLESENILVMNGDSYCHADLRRFWRDHVASSAAASMILSRVTDSSRYGAVQLTQDGFISSFQEKNTSSGPSWINAGIYMASRTLLETIPTGAICSLEREIFPFWIKRGLRGVKYDGPFIDIGTPESYSGADRMIRQLAPSTLAKPDTKIDTIRDVA
ncbi:MAG: nucleotidyltransferase family protein [Opitutaceae bacterium]